MRSIDVQLSGLAAQQHGLITKAQATLVGVRPDQLKWWLRTGRLEGMARGVYRIGGSPPTWRQATLAGCLATGGLASHHSAAALLELVPPPPRPHVTVPYGCSPRLPLANVHRTRIDPLDIDRRDGIPCTSTPRCLVDAAGLLGRPSLQHLVDSAMHARLVTVDGVEAAIERAGPRRGIPTLRSLLLPWHATIKPGSPAEMRLIRQIIGWGYPEPERQIRVYGPTGEVIARVDLGWSGPRLGLEYDSPRWHGPSQWAHDEARHRAVTVAGWTLLHADKTDAMPGERALRDALARFWRRAA